MHYKASKNDSVLGPMPHDPIYSGISCFSLYCKAQSLCLLPTANFGLLKILQDGSYLSQSYTWSVCNVRLPELCRTAVLFREMSLSELTPSFLPHSQSWCHCVLYYLYGIFLYSQNYVVSILAHLSVNCDSHCNRNHMHHDCCLCQMLSSFD